MRDKDLTEPLVLVRRRPGLELGPRGEELIRLPGRPSISLFTGIGGMDLGLERGGFCVLCQHELNRECCGTLIANRHHCFEYSALIQGDIKKTPTSMILREAGLRVGECALICGGPPCQGFSTAGKRDPGDIRNTLVSDFVRVVREAQPAFFVFENVPGFTSMSKGAFLRDFLSLAYAAGYELVYGLIDCVEYGVPQYRCRLICMGTRRDLAEVEGVLASLPAPQTFSEADLAELQAIDETPNPTDEQRERAALMRHAPGIRYFPDRPVLVPPAPIGNESADGKRHRSKTFMEFYRRLQKTEPDRIVWAPQHQDGCDPDQSNLSPGDQSMNDEPANRPLSALLSDLQEHDQARSRLLTQIAEARDRLRSELAAADAVLVPATGPVPKLKRVPTRNGPMTPQEWMDRPRLPDQPSVPPAPEPDTGPDPPIPEPEVPHGPELVEMEPVVLPAPSRKPTKREHAAAAPQHGYRCEPVDGPVPNQSSYTRDSARQQAREREQGQPFPERVEPVPEAELNAEGEGTLEPRRPVPPSAADREPVRVAKPEPTTEDVNAALNHALTFGEMDLHEMDILRRQGASDEGIRAAMDHCWHSQVNSRGFPGRFGYTTRGGSSPAFWMGREPVARRVPVLAGKNLINRVREMFEIRQPDNAYLPPDPPDPPEPTPYLDRHFAEVAKQERRDAKNARRRAATAAVRAARGDAPLPSTVSVGPPAPDDPPARDFGSNPRPSGAARRARVKGQQTVEARSALFGPPDRHEKPKPGNPFRPLSVSRQSTVEVVPLAVSRPADGWDEPSLANAAEDLGVRGGAGFLRECRDCGAVRPIAVTACPRCAGTVSGSPAGGTVYFGDTDSRRRRRQRGRARPGKPRSRSRSRCPAARGPRRG